eukprot:4061038-Prymnesium_polylepis.1
MSGFSSAISVFSDAISAEPCRSRMSGVKWMCVHTSAIASNASPTNAATASTLNSLRSRRIRS